MTLNPAPAKTLFCWRLPKMVEAGGVEPFFFPSLHFLSCPQLRRIVLCSPVFIGVLPFLADCPYAQGSALTAGETGQIRDSHIVAKRFSDRLAPIGAPIKRRRRDINPDTFPTGTV
jgi:hypothetical protein